MKRLILMRHAHAKPNAKSDFDRELSELGFMQAMQAGDFLSNVNIDKILVSPSLRTITSLNKILEKTSIPFEILDEIYNGSSKELLEIINNQENITNSIMILGHNPVIYELALSLMNKNSQHYAYLIDNMIEPATIIIIDFKIEDWKKVSYYAGDCYSNFSPKN